MEENNSKTDIKTKENKKPDIKIFVSHRIDLDAETIDNPLYVNVRCGAVYDKRENIDMLGDDTGDNISEKRNMYNELTVQYWAWKNIEADYYGLCHYRRYISFADKEYKNTDAFNTVNDNFINDNFIEKYGLTAQNMIDTITKYDIVTIKPTKLKNMSIYQSFLNHSYTFDIKIVDQFIATAKKLYPYMSKEIDLFFNGNIWRGFNCYIMSKKIFHEYSLILFNILFSVENKVNFDNCNREQLRTLGYMSEAFSAIYINYLKKRNMKVLEKQLVKIEYAQKKETLKPIFTKDYIPLSIASSNEYVPIASVLLTSILENSSYNNNYDIIILSQNISDKNKRLIKDIFREHKNFSIRFIEINTYLADKNLHVDMHVKPITYARLLTLDILSEYDKIIYLDSDTVVNFDIAELYKINLGNNYIAAVRDSVMAGWINYGSNEEKECYEYNRNVIGINSRFDYFNAGVIYINLHEIRKKYSAQQLIEIAESRNWRWFDQEVLNKISVGKVKWLDNKYNVMVHVHNGEKDLAEFYSPYKIYKEYLSALKNPKIIHYAGNVLPCYTPYVDNSEYFWRYAKKSPFYETILHVMAYETSKHCAFTTLDHFSRIMFPFKWLKKVHKIGYIRQIADKLLPHGTKRRKIVKKLIYG